MKSSCVFLALILVHVLFGEGQSQGSGPTRIPLKNLGGDAGTCPASQATATAQSELRQNISAILSNLVAGSVRCGGTGWRRVGFLNMTDPAQNCPTGLALKNYSPTLRTCGRAGIGRGCWSTFYNTGGSQYSRVCGRVRGYQFGATSAFGSHNSDLIGQTLDSPYVEGVSITHGAADSRTHIWTFAAGLAEVLGPNFANQHCPCGNSPMAPPAPSFVGSDYFCESGLNAPWDVNPFAFHGEDPLWDGQDCLTCLTNCCQFNNPPYFTKTLPASTSNNIELRVCSSDGAGTTDSPIDQVEIYVQ